MAAIELPQDLSEGLVSFFKELTRKEAAQAKQQEADLIAADILARKAVREENELLATDRYYMIFHLNEEVNSYSAKTLVEEMSKWARMCPAEPLTLRINSPGGDILSGFMLFDFLRGLQNQGHHITTVAFGTAASMAGVIFQVGDKRIIGENAHLLVHEATFRAAGSFGKVEDEVKFVKMLHERIMDIFIRKAQGKITREQFEAGWKRTDWWMGAEEAVRLGFADEVL
mgnify:CR=1 FL=1